jgi:transcriptional regulator of arginine metabolism
MKYQRHAKILELIEKEAIETQEELAERLRQLGFNLTQATVSRDIKELKLIKTMSEDGRSRYAVLDREGMNVSDKLNSIFAQSFVSSDHAGNIVMVRTLPGMAQAAAFALDSLKWPEIVGTIAGDDTIMILCRTEKSSYELVKRFGALTGTTE